jgi:protein TonB
VPTQPTFTPFTVQPQLRNAAEVQGILQSEYPALLRDAGVGGRVIVWFFIDENGTVQNAQVNEGSGQPQIDEAALRVARQFDFSPAQNGDLPTAVWVQIPITFQPR